MGMVQFKFAPEADTNDTSRRGEIFLAPKTLVQHFGPPLEFDGYKVSGIYAFVNEAGNVFTVYDHKATSLFNDYEEPGEKSILPTPDELWAGDKKKRLYIGGHKGGNVEEFKKWLLAELGK